MPPRYCPHCGAAAMVEDAEVGGHRCRRCQRPVHVIMLDQVPVDGGKQVKRIAAAVARKVEKSADTPATPPTETKSVSDKPLSHGPTPPKPSH